MDCVGVTLPDGSRAIVCGTGLKPKRCACGSGKRADLLCDWKLAGGKTCDAKICSACSHVPAPDKDLCPQHAAEWKAMKR